MSAPLSADLAQIGKSVVIKGELSGSEDLYVDGQVEGSITLKSYSLTVGPNGEVKASVEAKGIIVQGKLEGNVQATECVELRKSAVVEGENRHLGQSRDGGGKLAPRELGRSFRVLLAEIISSPRALAASDVWE